MASAPRKISARGPRIHGDEGEDAELVGGEPEHQAIEVDLVARAQGKESQGGQTADHAHGEEHREDALVVLEQPEDHGERLAFAASATGGAATVILGDATIAPVYTAAHPAVMTRMILHTEASVGFGGQEVRILAETRWLLEHGWRAADRRASPAVACSPRPARRRFPPWPWPMPRPFSVPAVLRLRRLMRERLPSISFTPTAPSTAGWRTLAARSRSAFPSCAAVTSRSPSAGGEG